MGTVSLPGAKLPGRASSIAEVKFKSRTILLLPYSWLVRVNVVFYVGDSISKLQIHVAI
jgi:hypothetical protein